MPDHAPAPSLVDIHGVRIPTLMYGTAWKEDRTAPLVMQALRAGFRGIDTANQRKHYHEAGVGTALRQAFDEGLARREDLFIQTKFTYVRGQDHRLPYDPAAPASRQVEQSVASSLEHLGIDMLDGYLLHGPAHYPGLAQQDRDTWRAMEAAHAAGQARLLGISNVMIDQLETLFATADVKPAIVQNRTFTRPDADGAVRAFCREHSIAYQGFSLLTAIPHVLTHPALAAVAMRLGRTPAEVMLAFCQSSGMIVLTGTTSPEHMSQDLSAGAMDLTKNDMAVLEQLVA